METNGVAAHTQKRIIVHVDIWIHGHGDTKIRGYMDTWIQGYMDTRIQGYESSLLSKETIRNNCFSCHFPSYHPGIWNNSVDTWIHGYVETWTLGNVDTWEHGYIDTWIMYFGITYEQLPRSKILLVSH